MKPKTPYLKIFLISFILNLIWEYLHHPLYSATSPAPAANTNIILMLILLIATLADATTITIIFWLNTKINKNKNWMNHPSPKDYIIITSLLLIIAYFVEYYALTNKIWGYNQYTPLIFGIGLTPLIQLSTTAIITLLMLKKLLKSK